MYFYDVILHPTDFSEESDQAFALACNMAHDQYASIVVLHVIPPEFEQQCQSEADFNEDHSPVIENCRQHFCRMKALAPDIPVEFRVTRGHAVGAILRIASEVKADVMVIASHRHTQFHLQLHGSIAEGILRQTQCPVVLLRQPQSPLKPRREKTVGVHKP